MMNSLPIEFLKQLKENNNRDWFNANKHLYEEAREVHIEFVSQLINEIAVFDKSVSGLDPKKSIFRIYRDVRFSKDKSPYKTTFGAYIANGGRKSINAAYYVHFEPGESFLAGGIYRPDGPNLLKVRQEIQYNIKEFKSIIKENDFIKYFNEVKGEKLKRPPKGFPADFEEIELLKHKDFLAVHSIDEKLATSNELMDYAIDVFKSMKPFNDFLNRAID